MAAVTQFQHGHTDNGACTNDVAIAEQANRFDELAAHACCARSKRLRRQTVARAIRLHDIRFHHGTVGNFVAYRRWHALSVIRYFVSMETNGFVNRRSRVQVSKLALNDSQQFQSGAEKLWEDRAADTCDDEEDEECDEGHAITAARVISS